MCDKRFSFRTRMENITSPRINRYETFVCVVKKVGCEAFLGFAGIGPYHVSENPDKGTEESKLYFPDVAALEETQSDDEEKAEELMENPEDSKTEAT